MDKRGRVSFSDDESDENLRGSIIKGKQALSVKENEFKWENPSLSLIASALRILTEQNKIIMKQNELILRELETKKKDLVRDAVRAALDTGGDGVILSRKYSEMRLANLRAVGEALRA